MARREPSLFTRLIVLISLVLMVGAAALTTAAWYYARAAANNAYDRLLVGAAYQMAEALTVQGGTLTVELPVSAFELLANSERDRIFYKIVDPGGRTLTGYPDLTTPESDAPAMANPEAKDGRFKGVNVRVTKVGRFFSDPSVQGRVDVVVAQTTEARTALARELTLRAVALIIVMSALALGGAVFAIRYALRPIGRVGAALRDRDPHDVTLITVSTPRELRPFVSATNEFITRLKSRMDLMQQFIADAAHQIRTPLTALKAQLQLLSRQTMEPQGLQHLARVQERVDQLSRLASQLLSHAMVNHRAGAVPLEIVDVVEVVRRAIREAVPETLDRDVLTSLELPPDPVTIEGDAISLKEAVKNVVDNAVRHGAPTQLTLRVRRQSQTVDIEVEDDGPGIPPELWPQVTERFGAPSPGGSGLGLSIAADVLAAHGGRLTFRHADGNGFAIIMSLPSRIGLKL
ncbi:sensor histidine kinase [Microvirga sp. HBU67558]|uniref:sensor histidine kinase n=1 Tax=Microvirga TaxID=186650 RepID=UPI001B383576|nr:MULTISPECIES: sensor histidine kinase [unclassified Microvirga]MBQ0819928.1 sensor histidine kinase [Microvirga sp. HBU67558]